MKFKLYKFFAAIYLLLFYSFLYFPMINLFIESFTYNDKLSLNWFYLLFNRKDIILAFFNSFFIALASIVIAIILSLFGLYYIFLNGNPNFPLKLLKINIVMPEIILTIALLMFYTKFGIQLGIISVIIPYVIMSLGYIFPILHQKLLSISNSFIRAAYDLGGNNWFIWKTIVMPILKSSIIVCIILGFILLFDDYIVVYFCGSPNFLTLSTPILSMLRMGMLGEIKALSVILILISVVLTLFYLIFSDILSKKMDDNEI